ncbi:sensor histidine kinase [Paenibacillus macerans]|nr:histidine kinase [Paenibacillus macerans]KFN12116.1 histidine kinase family protein [Paenibacillus macerans]MCY7558385.1 histidine kinase [Paenibacillus macerans]MEC0150370.1 histidine kinase [Paenibacillus macerans]SUA84287.1 histidine kinase [Paenibacillus macerans]
MLQAQVHPHFLFNVLSSIRLKLLMKGDEETALVVGSLSSLLRASLSKQDEFALLYAEIETAKQYTDLMKFTTRFPIETRWEIHADPFAVTVPRFILQPIIENAYKHGFSRSGGMISVKAQSAGSSLKITVEDNGQGMTPETLEALKKRLNFQKRELIEQMALGEEIPSAGIGLFNVYSRLKLLYGDRFDMDIQSERGRGTSVELLLPVEKT